jgi:hypothetical protein
MQRRLLRLHDEGRLHEQHGRCSMQRRLQLQDKGRLPDRLRVPPRRRLRPLSVHQGVHLERRLPLSRAGRVRCDEWALPALRDERRVRELPVGIRLHVE